MNDLESLYISISDDFELLKFPSYGILRRKVNSNINQNNRMELGKNSTEGTVELINKEAVKVLEFCDGKRKLKEIVEMFSYGDHVRREKIKQFLIQAVNKGHLVLKEKKRIISVSNVKGKDDYYLPAHLVIELTDDCNLKCVHCYRTNSRGKYIDYDSLKSLLHILSTETVCSVEFTGGEPTLHPNFLEIMEFAVQRFWLVGILTNAVELTDEVLEKLSAYRDRVFWSISLDSHDENYHDRFRGRKGAWIQTVNNIKKIVSQGYFVRISMCVTHENIPHIKSVAELCSKMGVKAFSYSPILPFGKSYDYIWQYNDILKLSEEDKYVRQKYGNIIPYIQLKEFNKEHINENCGAGW